MSDEQTPVILATSPNQTPWKASALNRGEHRGGIVYRSESMGHLMKMVEKVAPSQANILVLGESGTGKELIARAIHEKSNRSSKAFVAINCGALRETLLESELFGHEKGAFTGAFQRKIGLAESANGGTLFLDEVGELSPAIQSKLLRFIQEGEVYRVGGKDPIKVDIRLICATNRELELEVHKGNFREDLYYRINTIVVKTPPLRRRKEDVAVLFQHFLGNPQHFGQSRKTLTEDALKVLTAYDWPGNIRELKNVCERLHILVDGSEIHTEDLPENIRNPEMRKDELEYSPELSIHELEKRYIIKALQYFGGNKTQAATALGITIKTLYNKLHEYGEFDKYSLSGRIK